MSVSGVILKRREREILLQVVVNCLMCVLGTELWSLEEQQVVLVRLPSFIYVYMYGFIYLFGHF